MRGKSLYHKQTLEEFIELAVDKERRRILMLLWGILFVLVIANGLIGASYLLIPKILGAVLAILGLRLVAEQNLRMTLAFTRSLVFIYTGIVLWNIAVFFMGI